jgi:hypothetical protein
MSDLDHQDKFKVQLEWLREQGADLRARTQAEYLYTAAALALFGGVCWGIPAQQSGLSRVLVAIGVVIVALLIVWKIIADHETYRKIWIARGIIIGTLEPVKLPPKDSLFPEPEDNRPRRWPWVEWGERLTAAYLGPDTLVGLRGEPGPGYLISIFIVLGAALLAALFCILLALA